MSLQIRNQTSGALERVAGFNDTDSILSPSSKNPISNRAVYAALTQKIDKTVTDLINYYDKSQVYTKPEVRALIGSINTLTIEVVAQLPTQDISTTTIYFVGPAAGTNNYDEYVYVGGNWVQIGDTTIDLSNYVTSANLTTVLQDYYTKSQADALFDDYYDKDAVDDLLDTKQDTLTFDNTPISGSSNPVTSAGIKTALDNILISGNGGSIIKVHHLDGGVVAGDTVTASKGSFSVFSTFDNNGDAIITGVGEIGTIQITATNGTDIGIAFINIPSFSLYSTTISYGVNYKSWLEAGGLNPSSYSSLDELLEDEEAIRRLFTIHASVDYLVSAIISDDNEDAIKIFNNDLCAKWISLRDYAMDTLPTNEHIATIMENADKYGYGEWALVGQVPTMTSNTAPYGEAISSAAASSNVAYLAFDNNTETMFQSSANPPANQYCGFKFPKAIKINEVSFIENISAYKGYRRMHTYNIEASNDNTNWIKLAENVEVPIGKDTERVYCSFDNENNYLYYRIYCVTGTTQTWSFCIAELQFYAWQPKGNVPVMTSNTAPYGAVSASSYEQCSPYHAFDQNMASGHGFISNRGSSPCYVSYNFTNPIKLKKTTLIIGSTQNLGSTIITFKVQCSDDGSTWNDVPNASINVSKTTDTAYWQTYTILINNFDEYHLYYRVYSAQPLFVAGSYALVTHIQFYGREMKVSVPAMTSDTAPYGEAIHGGIFSSSYDAYMAFDKSTSTRWNGNNSTANYVGYKFSHPVIIKKVWHNGYTYGSGVNIGIIQGSNDKIDWEDLSTAITLSTGIESFDINNTKEFLYYRINYPNAGIASEYELQFYGFDYSERDWDTEHPMTYLYDHGVEPTDVITSIANASGNTFIKEPSRLTINKTTTSAWNAMYPTNQIDVTDYTLARAVSTDGTGINGTASLATCSNLSTGATDSYKVMATNLAPYHQYNDMTNVNTSRWITIGFGTNVTGNIAISEWWLEQ